jgi:hypothetical protein
VLAAIQRRLCSTSTGRTVLLLLLLLLHLLLLARVTWLAEQHLPALVAELEVRLQRSYTVLLLQ